MEFECRRQSRQRRLISQRLFACHVRVMREKMGVEDRLCPYVYPSLNCAACSNWSRSGLVFRARCPRRVHPSRTPRSQMWQTLLFTVCNVRCTDRIQTSMREMEDTVKRSCLFPLFFFFLNLAPESKYLMNKNKDSRFTPGEEFVENIGSYQTTVHTHTHIKPT